MLLIILIHRTSIDIKLLTQNYSKLKCHQMTKHAKTRDWCFLMDFYSSTLQSHLTQDI